MHVDGRSIMAAGEAPSELPMHIYVVRTTPG